MNDSDSIVYIAAMLVQPWRYVHDYVNNAEFVNMAHAELGKRKRRCGSLRTCSVPQSLNFAVFVKMNARCL
jgi:hypothetical protein